MGNSIPLDIRPMMIGSSSPRYVTEVLEPVSVLLPVLMPVDKRNSRMVCMSWPLWPRAWRPLAGPWRFRGPSTTWPLPALLASHAAELQGRPAPPLLALQG